MSEPDYKAAIAAMLKKIPLSEKIQGSERTRRFMDISKKAKKATTHAAARESYFLLRNFY